MAGLIHKWFQYAFPESLVAGDGPYARALASVFGVECIFLDDLQNGPKPNANGAYPQVLEELKRALFIVTEDMSAADVLHCHRAVWEWVRKLSPARDQHELAFVFVLSPNAPNEFEDVLADGLGMARIDPAKTGHAVWRCSGSFVELLELLVCMHPMDLLSLRARQAADTKRSTLLKLRRMAAAGNSQAVREAARAVFSVFSGREYLLDVFCRAPSHQNGNLLRDWLRMAVADAATQQGWIEEMKRLTLWLAAEESGHA